MSERAFSQLTMQHVSTSDQVLERLAELQLGQDQPISQTRPKSHDFGDLVAYNSSVHQGDVYYLNNIPEPATPNAFGLCLGSAPLIEANDFIGRTAELDQMAQKLQVDEIFTEQQRLVLGGIGGIGKTQLAIAYIRRHQASYSSVFWLNATTESSLKTDFRALSQQLLVYKGKEPFNDDDDGVQPVLRWLADLNHTGWLLIFDNYDNPDLFDITRYTPKAAHGSVIVTTRLGDLVNMPQVRVGPIGSLNESLQILQIRSQRQNITHDDGALDLARRLQGLPLALATAGSYLRKTTLSFRQYLEAYDQRFNINTRRPVQLPEYRDRTLYTTWDLSFARLERDDALAAHTLQLLAYFDNQDIWFALLHAGLDGSQFPEWLQELFGEEVDFENVMSVLVEYCFVEITPTVGTYSMHNCVHDWTLARLNETIDQDLYWYAVNCVAQTIQDSGSITLTQPSYARLAHQATRSVHYRFTKSILPPVAPLHRTHQMLRLACLVAQQLDLGIAEKMYLRVLECVKRWLHPDHFLTSYILLNLGTLYECHGKFDAAEEMVSLILFEKTNLLAVDNATILTACSTLSTLDTRRKKLLKLEQSHPQVLVGCDEILGYGDLSTIDTVNYLGVVYLRQGRLEEAEIILTKVLTAKNQIYGPDNPSTLGVLHDLARLFCAQGKLEQAEQSQLKCLEGQERLFGSEHFFTLDTRKSLADIYDRQNRFSAAEQVYLGIMATLEKATEKEYVMIATLAILPLADMYVRQGGIMFDKAEQMYQRALSIYETLQAPDEAVVLSTRHDLCRTICLQIQSGALSAEQRLTKMSLLISLARAGHTYSTNILGFLGKALLYVGDESNASKAFGQQRISRNRGVICDGCNSLLIDAARQYVCKQCTDFDLCGQCWDERESGALDVATCRDHTFFSIEPAFSTLSCENTAEGTQYTTVWLEQLAEKYEKARD